MGVGLGLRATSASARARQSSGVVRAELGTEAIPADCLLPWDPGSSCPSDSWSGEREGMSAVCLPCNRASLVSMNVFHYHLCRAGTQCGGEVYTPITEHSGESVNLHGEKTQLKYHPN